MGGTTEALGVRGFEEGALGGSSCFAECQRQAEELNNTWGPRREAEGVSLSGPCLAPTPSSLPPDAQISFLLACALSHSQPQAPPDR